MAVNFDKTGIVALNFNRLILITAFMLFHSLAAIAVTPEDAFSYISPVSESKMVLRETTVLLRTGTAFNQSDSAAAAHIGLIGETTGAHEFEVIFSDDSFTLILKPLEYFDFGENVIVNFDSIDIGGSVIVGSFQFEITADDHPLLTEKLRRQIKDEVYGETIIKHDKPIDESLILENDVSLPADFPVRDLLVNDNPDSGFVFVGNIGRDAGVPYIMILDNDAYPVFYRRMPIQTWDFKVQPNGYLTYIMENTPYFMVMDSTYTVIDSFRTMNGYFTDEHDFQMLDDGHVLIAAYDYQTVDMSVIVPGGNPEATVIGYVIQELDSNKNVVFQWRTWDYVQITEATYMGFGGSTIDYVHGNTLELDDDGHILTSFRNMESMTKINRQTGEIIWRLGGVSNQFDIANDSLRWSRQHDIRRLPNGHITIYDNARLYPYPYNNSHASEYALDEDSMTCTLIWEYANYPRVYGPFMGNAQRLSNGNTMIGWGGRARLTATEVRMDSTKAWEMTFSLYDDHRIYSFRSFRFNWHGVAARPYLIIEPSDTNIHLIFNKFGDSSVVKYYIYAGQSSSPTTIVDSTSNTYADLADLPSGLTYFRVTAVDSLGVESPFSNEVTAGINFSYEYLPGDANMFNGIWPPEVISGDVTYLVNYFRLLPSSPPCIIADFYCAADLNGDCQVIGSDVTSMVNYFRNVQIPQWCPEYPPAWFSPDDLPEQEPNGWPGCEPLE
jgi:hypothetical protein